MKIFTLLTILLAFNYSYSQNNWCGFDYFLQKEIEQNPNYLQDSDLRMARAIESGLAGQDRNDSIIIPVVVHILHDNEIGDISHAQIQDALRILNEDFNRTNADTVDTRNTVNAPFSPVAANLKICFILAKKDPQGNCTNGVERRNSALGTYDANNQSAKFYNGGGLNAWNRNNYFNIWVVNSIENFSGGGGILGYGQFPDNGAANTYGIVIRNDAFGSIGTGTGDRTFTHEIGHNMGLYHTFQNGCGSNSSNCQFQGDRCCDTPPVDQAHWSCNLSQNFCNTIPNNDAYGIDAYDQYENYMSYSPCQNMFSEDQKTRVWANLNSISFMISLTSSTNLQTTGVSLPLVLCKAEFEATKKIICAGESVDFSDLSYSGVSTRTWTFNGATIATSTDSLVNVTFNTPGVYTVSLSVSDGNSTEVETKVDYMVVLPSPGIDLPIIEGFETIVFPDNYNFFSSGLSSSPDWIKTNLAAHTDDYSVYFNNFYDGAIDKNVSFISNSIDLSILDPVENLILSFDYAYNKKAVNNDEYLKVSVSNDCGETWLVRKTIHGNILNNVISTTAYFPASQDEWKHVEISSINSTYYTANFRYKFEFVSDEGNNIFIDNINLYPESWLGLDKLKEVEQYLTIYPNPAQNIIQLKYTVSNDENVSIEIYNTSGQLVKSEIKTNSFGVNTSQINVNDLPKGVYIVHMKGTSNVLTSKFIKD